MTDTEVTHLQRPGPGLMRVWCGDELFVSITPFAALADCPACFAAAGTHYEVEGVTFAAPDYTDSVLKALTAAIKYAVAAAELNAVDVRKVESDGSITTVRTVPRTPKPSRTADGWHDITPEPIAAKAARS